MAIPSFGNPSFESPSVGTYQLRPPGYSWVWTSGTVGVTRGDAGRTGPQCGFAGGSGEGCSQMLAFDGSPVSIEIWACCASSKSHSVDGVITITVGGTAWDFTLPKADAGVYARCATPPVTPSGSTVVSFAAKNAEVITFDDAAVVPAGLPRLLCLEPGAFGIVG